MNATASMAVRTVFRIILRTPPQSPNLPQFSGVPFRPETRSHLSSYRRTPSTESPNAPGPPRRPTSRPAACASGSPPASATRFHPPAPRRSRGARSPPPTPRRSPPCRTARIRSAGSCRPAPSACRPSAPAPPAVRPALSRLRAPVVRRIRPRTHRVLPLRFAEQAVRLSRPLREPAHVLLRILPAHVDCRPVPPAPALVVRRVRAAAGAVARVPLGEGDLIPPHRERPADRDPMPRAFVLPSARFVGRRAHHVRTLAHHHHLRAVQAAQEDFTVTGQPERLDNCSIAVGAGRFRRGAAARPREPGIAPAARGRATISRCTRLTAMKSADAPSGARTSRSTGPASSGSVAGACPSFTACMKAVHPRSS